MIANENQDFTKASPQADEIHMTVSVGTKDPFKESGEEPRRNTPAERYLHVLKDELADALERCRRLEMAAALERAHQARYGVQHADQLRSLQKARDEMGTARMDERLARKAAELASLAAVQALMETKATIVEATPPGGPRMVDWAATLRLLTTNPPFKRALLALVDAVENSPTAGDGRVVEALEDARQLLK